MIRRLVNANFKCLEVEKTMFMTVTFAENMQDLEVANYEFKKFVQKLQRRKKGFKFLSVIEFQKRGAIHYHMVCNFPVKKDIRKQERELASLWGNGFIDVKEVNEVDNVGAYLVKYMTKDNINDKLKGKKSYFYSRKMKKPRVLEGEELFQYLQSVKDFIPVFTSTYDTEWNGECKYREYNYLRG